MTSVSEAVAARKSVRAFLPERVPEDMLRELITKAARAPSGGNVQPWFVHVVTGKALENLKDRTRKSAAQNPAGEGTEYPVYPAELAGEYKNRQRKVAGDMYQLLGIGREDKMGRMIQMAQNFEFFGAPAAIFFSIDRIMGPNQWAHMGMYMQTLALLAQEAGLATCMQEAWAGFHKTVGDFLSLPPERMLYCGLSIGYEDTEAVINSLKTERAPLDQFATFLNGD